MIDNRNLMSEDGEITDSRSPTAMRVLVAEDYAPLRQTLVEGLREAGFAVDDVADGKRALLKARQEPYDVVVLDLQLPEMDGLSVLRTLRREGIGHAVLILTARDGIEDRVRGLDAGGDDYLVKPFAFEELLARVRALVRRSYADRTVEMVVGPIRIDTAARHVTCHGRTVDLTAREYALLEYLARRKGQIVAREDIWNHVYDFSSTATSNVIDVYVGYLRRKLDRVLALDGPSCIQTLRGRGYRMVELSAAGEDDEGAKP
jgi:DNA-binding response OmpR family regulator